MADLLAPLIALIIVFCLVMALGRRYERRSNSKALYQNMLRKCAGDKAQVERLIEGERKRHPGASTDRLIKYAIDRWEDHRK